MEGTKRILSILCILGLLPLGHLAAEPASAGASKGSGTVLDRFTAKERKRLEDGKAVFRHVEAEGEDAKSKGEAYAWTLVNKPVDECFRIIQVFDKHPEYFPHNEDAKVVRTEGNRTWVTKTFHFYLVTMVYTVKYTVHPELHRMDLELAPEYPHDINDTAGFFLFEAVEPGLTLFSYAVTRVDTGVRVPGFIRRYLTSRDLPNMVLQVKRRIESGGTWNQND